MNEIKQVMSLGPNSSKHDTVAPRFPDSGYQDKLDFRTCNSPDIESPVIECPEIEACPDI